jgi:adenine-specific DNA methylase
VDLLIPSGYKAIIVQGRAGAKWILDLITRLDYNHSVDDNTLELNGTPLITAEQMIERDFDIPFVAQLAQREKQIQQHYRPIIGVHKWFARRPGTLFRALLLAEFTNGQPLQQRFFDSHDLAPITVGDPFMGGGSPLLEANRLGCHIVGTDINPMAYWIVRQEIAEIDRQAFQDAAQQVIEEVEAQVGDLYQTTCTHCGSSQIPVKYFLWVKQLQCTRCSGSIDLFPNFVVAKNQRHPNYLLLCPSCGSLNEKATLNKAPGAMTCGDCQAPLVVKGPARRSRCACPNCGHENVYPQIGQGAPKHRLFALEYHCPTCKPEHHGRFFKAPDEADIARFSQAERRLQKISQAFVPDERIPPGDETTRLHRWGYETYRQLFNPRQLLGLNTLATAVAAIQDEPIQHALLTVFSDTLRYQNMLCRYDSYALKIIDIFSVHGFPVSLMQCENSLLGIPKVGSGGFRHFTEKFDKAKAYGERPFETTLGKPRRKVFVGGEQIGARLTSSFPKPTAEKSAYLQAASADTLKLPPNSLEAILTDPPYFANVQYAELMDFCYVWLKKHLAKDFPAFRLASTRAQDELTVNETEGRDIVHFTEGLSRVFGTFTQALKPGSPFVFTYHHNQVKAYLPIAVALLDAGLVCTRTLPCPAEMGASIHINGTKSSTVDSIFVCRTTGLIQASDFDLERANLDRLLRVDLEQLQLADLAPTEGDARCLLFGHMVRLAIWQLHPKWNRTATTKDKLDQVKTTLQRIHPIDLVPRLAIQILSSAQDVDLLASMRVRETQTAYVHDEISF